MGYKDGKLMLMKNEKFLLFIYCLSCASCDVEKINMILNFLAANWLGYSCRTKFIQPGIIMYFVTI